MSLCVEGQVFVVVACAARKFEGVCGVYNTREEAEYHARIGDSRHGAPSDSVFYLVKETPFMGIQPFNGDGIEDERSAEQIAADRMTPALNTGSQSLRDMNNTLKAVWSRGLK